MHLVATVGSEAACAGVLERLDDVEVLHARRPAKGRSAIDHLAVGPAGVWVVVSEECRGRRVEAGRSGPWRHHDERLFVGGRAQGPLISRVVRQVDAVRSVLATAAPAVPVRGVVCLLSADWPLLGGPLTVGAVTVCWPGALARIVARAGCCGPGERHRIAALLAGACPPVPRR